MATYDLDRWSKQIRKRNHGEASLTLHLHTHHCRFEHQNGVFLYDSPIRGLLESIKDARLPVELLDLLDATAVKYYEGCLVVEVIDHRAVNEGAEASGSAAAHGSGPNGTSTVRGTEGADALSTGGGSHSRTGSMAGVTDSRRGSRSIFGDGLNNITGNEIQLRKPNLSLSFSDTGEGSAASAAFGKRFTASYERFEVAMQEASILKGSQGKDKSARDMQWKDGTRSSAALSQGLNTPDANKEDTGPDNTSLHSAIAAAVATATTMNAEEEAANGDEELTKKKPLVYRILLSPDIETVWTDLCAMREEKRAKWSEEDMLAIESRVLVRSTIVSVTVWLCLISDA